MPATSIQITKDNKEGQCNLLAVSSPLVFLIEVDYSLGKPDLLNVDVIDSTGTLATFRAIEYVDDGISIIYRFIANDVLSAYMNNIDDIETGLNSLEYVDGFTKEFTLKFYSNGIESETSFVALQGAQQFGDTECVDSVFYNEDLCFTGGIGEDVYVYFYNDSADNDLSINEPVGEDDAILDNDDYVFQDHDDYVLRSL